MGLSEGSSPGLPEDEEDMAAAPEAEAPGCLLSWLPFKSEFVGCWSGAGEWEDEVRDEDEDAVGADAQEPMVENCNQREIKVRQTDEIEAS